MSCAQSSKSFNFRVIALQRQLPIGNHDPRMPVVGILRNPPNSLGAIEPPPNPPLVKTDRATPFER
jgi:hypothetical protein